MAFVRFSRISLAFGGHDILKDVSLNLAAGSRACLAGANGSGKSTLLKVMAGKITADSGEIAVQRGTRISYLPQSGIGTAGDAGYCGKTLRDEAETAFAHIRAMLAEAEKIAVLLESAKSDDGQAARLMEEYHRLQEQVENSGYYRREALISSVLNGLGFSPNDIGRRTDEFSGGWQMRIALAKVLLEQPDILLLDEPTNYLDIEARNWLESWLEQFSGGYLLVSHDRFFLDVSVNEVYEIFQGNLKRYAGNYSAYEKTRQIELAGLLKRYTKQQEEIAKTESLIRRFRYKASKAAFAQELIKRLEKMERIEIPENLKKINISFTPPSKEDAQPHSPRVALTIEGLGKSYGEEGTAGFRRVLCGLDLTLDSGERLVVAGPNGAGKTTLLRILSGSDSDFEGTVKYGTGISVGYFSQGDMEPPHAVKAMSGNEQVLEFTEAEAPAALIPKVRDMLGAFLFCGDDVYKPVSVLSGGEKSRLALLCMLLKPANLLILDEPTNHLDLHSKDILLEALRQFKGTIIFVSHDRAFMDALSTKTLELSPGAVPSDPSHAKLFFGNYSYYLEKVNDDTKNIVNNINTNNTNNVNYIKKNFAEQRLQQKQYQAEIRRTERQEAEIIKTIEELESEKAKWEAELSRPEVYSNGEKTKAAKLKLDECTAGIREKTVVWETLAAQMKTLIDKSG